MNLAALHNAGRAAQEKVELEVDDMEDVVEQAPAPAAMSISGFGLEDGEGDDFADAPRGPKDEVPSPAVASGGDSLEDMLRAAGGAVSADPAAGEAPPPEGGATSEKVEEEKTEQEKSEEDFAQGGEIYTGSAIDLLDRLNLGARHRKLVGLLKSNEDPEVAEALATEYVNNLVDSGVLDQIMRADADKAQAEKMIQSAEQEGVYQTGGGALVSMLAGLLRFGRAPKGVSSDIQEAGKRRRSAEDQASGVAANMTERISAQKLRRYQQQMLEIGATAEQYRRSINSYNDAVLNASGNEALKAAVEARASENAWTIEHALADIAGGNADDDLKAHLAKAAETSSQNAEVVAASEAMHRMQDNLVKGFDGALRHAESLQDSGLLDPDRVQENIMAAFDAIEGDLPDPIAEAEEKRKLSERMRELREALMAGIQALIERLTSTLSSDGPAL